MKDSLSTKYARNNGSCDNTTGRVNIGGEEKKTKLRFMKKKRGEK